MATMAIELNRRNKCGNISGPAFILLMQNKMGVRIDCRSTYTQHLHVPRLDRILGLLICPLAIESFDVCKQFQGFLPLPLLELPFRTSGEDTDNAVPILWPHVVYAVNDVIGSLVGLIGFLSTLNNETTGFGCALVANLLTVHKSISFRKELITSSSKKVFLSDPHTYSWSSKSCLILYIVNMDVTAAGIIMIGMRDDASFTKEIT